MPDNLSGTTPVGTPSSMDVFNAANQAISFKEQLPDLAQKLREALTSKFTTANPLYAQRESAQQEFLNAPSKARADISQMQQTSGIPLSPTQQESITSGRRSAAFAPLSSANLMLGGAFGGLENIIGGGVKAFEAAAGAQTERANLLNQLRQQEIDRQFKEKELTLRMAGGGTATGRATAILNQVAQAARKGSTLKEIMENFGTSAEVNPNDILRIYNTNSKYGPAKESESQLMKLYGITPTSTAEQRNRQVALQPAITGIKGVRKLDLSKSGPQNQGAKLAIDWLGGLGVPQNLVSMNQQFELMKQNVVRSLQGARMSDTDIDMAKGYMPSILDTPATIKTKLANLENFIQGLSGKEDTMDTRPPLSSFEY